MMMGFIQAARSEVTASARGYSLPLGFATAPSTSYTQGMDQMESTSADSWWRPKWMEKLLNILNWIENAANFLSTTLEELYPPIVQSGSDGYSYPFSFRNDPDALNAMREIGITMESGVIKFSQKTLAFYDENDGRSIFIKPGIYKLDSRNRASVLLLAK